MIEVAVVRDEEIVAKFVIKIGDHQSKPKFGAWKFCLKSLPWRKTSVCLAPQDTVMALLEFLGLTIHVVVSALDDIGLRIIDVIDNNGKGTLETGVKI